MSIIVNLDLMISKRNTKSIGLSGKFGVTLPNLSILKNTKEKAISLTSLNTISKILQYQPSNISDDLKDK